MRFERAMTIIFLLALIMVAWAQGADAAEPVAQGADLSYASCQCTGYAWSRRQDLPSSGLGDAWRWATTAAEDRDGRRYSVGALPSENAVVVFQPGEQDANGEAGHVAYVEQVFSEREFYLTEKNWPPNPCQVHGRGAHTNPGQVHFIYQPIGYDEIKYGSVTRSYTRDRYGFWGYAGNQVTIRLNGRNGFDPYVYLRDPNGNIVTKNDDGGPGYSSLILNYRLPRTGAYTIDAAGFSYRTGAYSLKLERLGSYRPGGNLAIGGRAWATSEESGNHLARYAIDGRTNTRWSSGHGGRYESLTIELPQAYDVHRIRLNWETAYASRYWVCFYKPEDGRWWGWVRYHRGGIDDIQIRGVLRYQTWKIREIQRPGQWGNISLWEAEFYSPNGGPMLFGKAPAGGDRGNTGAIRGKIGGELVLPGAASESIELGEPMPVPDEIVRQFEQDALRIPALRELMLKAGEQ